MLTLASCSPQRRAILERIGVEFDVVVPDVHELEEGDPTEVAKQNALRKARAVRDTHGGAAVLGARHGRSARSRSSSENPRDAADARAMLRSLSGRTHTVVGGLALLRGSEERVIAAHTEVRFRALEERVIDWYVEREEWRGRAGGYAIQGAGAALVREVRGDYENVVGLPLASLLEIYPELLWR